LSAAAPAGNGLCGLDCSLKEEEEDLEEEEEEGAKGLETSSTIAATAEMSQREKRPASSADTFLPASQARVTGSPVPKLPIRHQQLSHHNLAAASAAGDGHDGNGYPAWNGKNGHQPRWSSR